MVTAELEAEARARATVYDFLARVFSGPPGPEVVRGVQELTAALGIACPDALAPADLDKEYMDLFVVPGPRYVAPYESVFRDRWPLPSTLPRGSNPGEVGRTIKGLVMGESTELVRRSYAEAGVAPSHELPDHIGNELRFVAHLWRVEADGTAQEAAAAVTQRQRFVTEHPLKWVRDLRERVAEGSETGFYRAAVEAADVLLGEEPGAVRPEEPNVALAGPDPAPPPARCPWTGHGGVAAPAPAPAAEPGHCPWSGAARKAP